MPTQLTLSLSLLRSGPSGIAEWNRLRAKGMFLFSHEDRSKLRGLDLHNADFRRMSFDGVDLAGVDLRGADLTNAYFFRANLGGTKIDAKWFEPDAEVYGLPVVVGDGE